jgi:hypothetical protein
LKEALVSANKLSRRDVVVSGAALLAGGAALLSGEQARAQEDRNPRPPAPPPGPARYTPVVTPNLGSLPWKMDNGVKVFHLVAEPVKREFAPGMVVNTLGLQRLLPRADHRGRGG